MSAPLFFRFFLAADGERRETAIDRNHENVRLRFDYESADPRFVAAILPALPDAPESAFRVTPIASGGKRVTVSYGPIADQFDWSVGEPRTDAAQCAFLLVSGQAVRVDLDVTASPYSGYGNAPPHWIPARPNDGFHAS